MLNAVSAANVVRVQTVPMAPVLKATCGLMTAANPAQRVALKSVAKDAILAMSAAMTVVHVAITTLSPVPMPIQPNYQTYPWQQWPIPRLKQKQA